MKRGRLIRKRPEPPLSRLPAVAGILYPERKEALADEVNRLMEANVKREEAIAVVVPHGSLLSSGRVAGAVYASVRRPVSAVLVGPVHGGLGQGFGVDPTGEWTTPLGALAVDGELARAILKASPDLKKDRKLHEQEHALEMQLLFLQRMREIKGFVPVAVGPADLETLQRIGEGIARVIANAGREILLVASSNLTTYRPAEEVQANDPAAIERILSLDEDAWLEAVSDRELSICGAAATAVVMSAAKKLGATGGRLVRYEMGGERQAQSGSAVGYAGILLQ